MADKFCESCEWWSYTYPDGTKRWGTCQNVFVTEGVRISQDEESIDDPTILTENNFGCIHHEKKDKNVLVRFPKF